jgi:SurA-like protein
MRRAAIAGAVLAGIALTGCEPAQLGSAAIVDGQRIAVEDVQEAVQDIRALQARVGQPAQQPEHLARAELQRRLILAVYERAARELGVRVTPGEVSAELARARQSAGSEEEFARQVASQNLSLDSAREFVRQSLLARKMGERLAPGVTEPGQGILDQAVTDRLVQTAKRMRFEVNPRYGTFNTENGQLVQRQDDFFGSATATPTPPGTVP